jgi:hypothetical protein
MEDSPWSLMDFSWGCWGKKIPEFFDGIDGIGWVLW